jgi:hypothetical protein
MKFRRSVYYSVSILLFFVSGYAFLWILSSSHLAAHYCNGEFALFHPAFRCRQPQIAMILWIVSGIGAVVMLVMALKSKSQADRKHSK